jgi:hypothetical protein
MRQSGFIYAVKAQSIPTAKEAKQWSMNKGNFRKNRHISNHFHCLVK